MAPYQRTKSIVSDGTGDEVETIARHILVALSLATGDEAGERGDMYA